MTFEIKYKSRLREYSEFGYEHIQARDEKAALKKFAKIKKLGKVNPEKVDNWTWWDGDWFERFWTIRPITVIPCPHCEGTGKISVDSSNGHN